MCSRQRTCQKKRSTWQTVWNTNFTWKGSSQFPEIPSYFGMEYVRPWNMGKKLLEWWYHHDGYIKILMDITGPWSDSIYLDVPYWWCTIVQICSNRGHHHHRGSALTTGRRPGPLVLSSLQRSALEEKDPKGLQGPNKDLGNLYQMPWNGNGKPNGFNYNYNYTVLGMMPP